MRFTVVRLHSLHNFIIFNIVIIIYLTISLFVVFITTLFLLRMHIDTIEGNISSATFWFSKFRNNIFQVFKLRSILCKILYNTHGYILNRICWCARKFVRWVEDVFAVFINNSFFLFRRTWIIFIDLIIIQTQTIFMLVWFSVASMHYIEYLQLFLIPSINYRLIFLKFFVPTTSDLTL